MALHFEHRRLAVAEIDNARGLLAVGTKVYVLHTAFGPTGQATGMNLAVLEDANRDGVADGPAHETSCVCRSKRAWDGT